MSALKTILLLGIFTISFFLISSVNAASSRPEALKAEDFNYFIYSQTSTEGGMGHAIMCVVGGFSILNKSKCAGYEPSGQLITYTGAGNSGALGAVNSTMAAMYTNQPLSSVYYLANLGESIGISQKPAYAQVTGSGETIIRPVFKLWQISRNMAYLAFIVIFLVIGLMVMLRAKISSQTVISAQQALPGLVIGLILVTFSYFFAALIVDLSFVGMKLVAELFTASGTKNFFAGSGVIAGQGQTGSLSDLAGKANVFGLMSQAAFNPDSFNSIREALSGQFGKLFGEGTQGIITSTVGISGIVALLIAAGLSGGWAALPLGFGGGVAATQVIIPVIVVLVLIIALLIQSFRLLFGLIGAYVQILVFTLAGPFFILIGSIPGKSGVTASWWKGLIGNVMIFPAVFAAFLFAGVMLGDDIWATTDLSNLPLFGGLQSSLIRVLLAYGILLATPTLPDMVRGAFGVKGGAGGVGQAALAGFMAGAGLGGTAGRPLGRMGANMGAQALQNSTNNTLIRLRHALQGIAQGGRRGP